MIPSSSCRQVMKANAQCLLFVVGNQVGLGGEYFAQQRTSVVGAAQSVAQNDRHGCLGAVGDHANSVDELFSRGRQLNKSFFLGQLAQSDVAHGFFAAVFQLPDVAFEKLDFFL